MPRSASSFPKDRAACVYTSLCPVLDPQNTHRLVSAQLLSPGVTLPAIAVPWTDTRCLEGGRGLRVEAVGVLAGVKFKRQVIGSAQHWHCTNVRLQQVAKISLYRLCDPASRALMRSNTLHDLQSLQCSARIPSLACTDWLVKETSPFGQGY